MANIDLTHVSALSVDLFDTLLLRSAAEPTDVFRRVGALAEQRGELQSHVTPGQFRIIRQGGEEEARRQKGAATASTEVTLAEIYSAIPDGVLAASPERLAATELEVEGDLIYPHPGTVELVLRARARGLRVAILSDTYYSANNVRRLLGAAGVDPTNFDLILTSSDAGVSKRDGGLFTSLLAHWPDLAPDSILHVGDHPHADVMRARAAGLRASFHDTGEEAIRESLRLESLRYGATSPELASLRRLAVSLDAPVQDDERWWFSLGASVLGPLCAGFADWVVESCARDGITVVRPLMREGALLASLVSRAADFRGIDLDVRPLYASRASTWLASIGAFDVSSARRLLQRQQLTVAEAFASLGLRIDRAPQALRDAADVRLDALAGAEADDPAGLTSSSLSAGLKPRPTYPLLEPRPTYESGSTLEDELLAYLSRPVVRVEIDHHSARARRLVSNYLEQECGAAADVALVDIGFHGSIGRSLEKASAQPGPQFHQFLLFGAEGVQRLWQAGHDIRVYGAGPADHADLAGPISHHPAVLEALLMDGGTTIGYRRKGNTVVPVVDEPVVPPTQQAATAACRAGIVAFQARWLDWRLLRSSTASVLTASPRTLVEPLHRLLTMPTTEEAWRLGALLHEDNDGGVSTRPIADPALVPADMSAEQFMQTALSSGYTSGVSWLWPAGVCEQRWPGLRESRWRQAAGTTDGAPAAIPAVAMKVREAGVRRCVVWGAGEAGAALVKACRGEGIEVRAVTDSNPALWGSAIEGVPVVSPEDARHQGTDVYAIGSLAFASDIERAIQRRYVDAGQYVRIFSATLSPTHEEAA